MVEEVQLMTEFQSQRGMEMEFNKITVKIKDKTILKGVNGRARPGEIVALMGPSGSGKTTLLNVLAGRERNIESGVISLDGMVLNKQLRRKICYVLQEDIFFNNLTLQEQLWYMVKFKLPSTATDVQRMKKIDDIVDFLDIRKCLGTKLSLLSGGERKRANIGCELMTDPAVLLLDEPTSGLDSFTAYNLVSVLLNFAKSSNKTIVMSIHQPSSRIFYAFENLLLLHEGETVYFGAAPKVVDYFANIGFPFEKQHNPADSMLEKLRSNDEDVKTIMNASRNTAWQIHQNKPSTSIVNNTDICNNSAHSVYYSNSQNGGKLRTNSRHKANGDNDIDAKWPTTYRDQFVTLVSRSFKESKSKLVSPVMFTTTVSIALVLSATWFQMGYTEDMINERIGLIFITLSIWTGTPMYLAMSFFPAERRVVNKERLSGLYRLSAYYFAKQTSEFPLMIFLPVVGYTIVYWLTGLNRTWPFAFIFSMGMLWLTAFWGQSLGMVYGLLFDNMRNGIVAASVLFMFSLVTAGFYIKAFPVWLQWVKYLSFVYYTSQAMVTLEFTNNKPFTCSLPLSYFEECVAYNGTNVVEVQPESILDFWEVHLPLWVDVVVLAVTAVILRIITYLLLKFYHKPK
ncbi:uncharacterized protein LOC144451504 [Glandiceps talaboti]